MASKSSRGPRPEGPHASRPVAWRRETQRQESDGEEASATFGRDRDEERVIGVHAAEAFARERGDDVLRVYLTEDVSRAFGPFLRRCAELRRPYRIVPREDLERLSRSTHHEGICIVARRRIVRSLDEVLAGPGPGWLVATSDVGNPHNVGAILRSAAHFGTRALLLAGAKAGLSAAAYRTAQGGAEYVDALAVDDLPAALGRCRTAGFTICATSSHEGRDLFSEPLPARAVLLFGAEGAGLAPHELKAADRVLRVPGTAYVESLNVSVTVGVMLAELWRQHGPRSTPRGPRPTARSRG